MSERASFVTEFLYCQECFDRIKAVLMGETGGYLTGQVSIFDRIIAGKVSCSAPTYEDVELVKLFNHHNAPCHPVKIVILSDCGATYICVVDTGGTFDRVVAVSDDVIKTHLNK